MSEDAGKGCGSQNAYFEEPVPSDLDAPKCTQCSKYCPLDEPKCAKGETAAAWARMLDD